MIFWIAFLRELLKRRHRGTRASVRAPDQRAPPDLRDLENSPAGTVKAGGGVELNGRRVATRSSVAACRRALRRPCDGAMRWNIDDTVLKRFSIG
jgi:hypothetical protein